MKGHKKQEGKRGRKGGSFNLIILIILSLVLIGFFITQTFGLTDPIS